MDLTPVDKVTAAQQTAEQILKLIQAGVWNPGDQLPPEREMLEKLQIGRSTLREALQILGTLNVVYSVAGKGNFVKAPRAEDLFRLDLISFLIKDAAILDLIETREMIEPQTVRLACLRASDEELAAIGRMLDAHEAALAASQPIAEFARIFHVMLAETSRNNVAVAFIRSLLDPLQGRRRVENSSAFRLRELAEHREILRLVQARDAQAAADYLIKHIVDSAVIDVA